MSDPIRAYGTRIGALLWVLVAVWAIGLVLAPLATMVGHSLSSIEPKSIETSVEIDRLYDEMTAARWDWERAETPEQRAELDRRIRLLTDRAHRLESRETAPEIVWGFDNYRRLEGLHARVLLRTLVYALLVTAISLAVCYPVAYAAAVAGSRARASLLLVALIVPYALNELLRIYAWAMILDPHGFLAEILAGFGLISPEGPGLTLLGPRGSVFLAMVYAYVLFMVVPVYNTLETLDPHQIEAARDLGASILRIHARIVVPHAKPGLAVGAVMTFMLSAGSYSVPQIMTRGQGGDWFSQLVWRRFFESAEWNVGAAYGVTLLVACLVVVFALMRLFRLRLSDIARPGG